MRLRSLLYVPAHVSRFVDKAHERGADAVILDLEDAVPEPEKDAARAALADAVPLAARSGAKVFVRVNATDRLAQDLAAAMAAGADGVMLPKVDAPAQLDAVPANCRKIIAIVESARGVLNARPIAVHPRVIAICLGSEDFATDTGAVPTAEVLRMPKLMLHYAAKAEGKLSLGLLRSAAQFDDGDALRTAAEEAASFGFDGATCIHPKVVAVLNAAFSPSPERLAWAQKVIGAAAEAAKQGRGAFLMEGEFIDAPIIARAHAIIARAQPDADS